MNVLTLRKVAVAAAAVAAGFVGGLPTALAAPAPYTLEQYTGPTITQQLRDTRSACLAVGDAVSCSAGMMNVLTGRGATNKMSATNPSQWGYVVDSAQGDLKDRIVIGTGGNASTDNGDVIPAAGAVEDGYKSNNARDKYVATGKDLNTPGNMNDPANNTLNPNWDRKGTWDVSIDWLINALTIDSVRRELMILFDYNQAENATGSLAYWSLISVLDYDGDTSAINRSINFEVKNTAQDLLKTPTQQATDFVTGKNENSKPAGSDFAVVNTKTCYAMAGGNVVAVVPITGGQCSQFDGSLDPAVNPLQIAGLTFETVKNATGDSTTEIFAFLPELNANLENYKAAGYDTISVRMLFGCFNDGDQDATTGDGYLSSGSTTQCDGGGNVDVYLMANIPNEAPPIPTPGTLALIGLGLGALGWSRRRARA